MMHFVSFFASKQTAIWGRLYDFSTWFRPLFWPLSWNKL